MISTDNEIDRGQFDYDTPEFDRFERFTNRSRGEAFPVRSQAARKRAKMRSRATPASRIKARSFNGSNRRGRGKQWACLT